MIEQDQNNCRKEADSMLLQTVIQIRDLVERLVSEDREKTSVGQPVEVSVNQRDPSKSKRRIIHIHDLVLGEGDWLMDTVEACADMGISRGTLVSHRDEGLLTEVRIGRKGGGVRFISSEVAGLREWYSVRKGKV